MVSRKWTRARLVALIVILSTVGIAGIVLLSHGAVKTSDTIEVYYTENAVTTLGGTTYTFKLYPYDQIGVDILRIEANDEFTAKGITLGTHISALGLEIDVVDRLGNGYRLDVILS